MPALVSIVMSAYNAEKYLAEAIESVLAQTYPHFEFIIINDGSKDRTLEIIKQYQAKDERIIVDDHENMGMANSCNRILPMLKGQFVARIDADDVMMPERIEKQVKFLQENPAIDMTSCYCYLINAKGKKVGVQHLMGFKSIEESKQAVEKGIIAICAHTGFMCRKEALEGVGGYRNRWPSDDTDLFNRMIEKGYVLVGMPEYLMKYRVHNQSIMASTDMKRALESEWVSSSIYRRRQGLPEQTFDEFMQAIRQEGFLKNLHRKRKHYGYAFYRNAGINYSLGDYPKFFVQSLLAVLLIPNFVFKKLLFQLKNK